MHTLLEYYTLHSTMQNSTHNSRIEEAIAELNSSDNINYSATAKKYNLDRITLARRHKGQTASRETAASTYKKKLSDAQEQELLKHICMFNERGFPPISRLIRNFA